MEGTFWAFLPAIVAIVLALISKQVYISLFFGIFVGAMMYAGGNPLKALFTLFNVMSEKVGANVPIIVFLVVLGILVVLMQKSGGARAYGDWAGKKIKTKGVKIAYITLHVGIGTFRPVKADDITQHHMHSEHYWLPAETAELINETKVNGGRVIGVGTTSCRTLESVATFEGEIRECEGWTDIFIYPGYKFKCIDALITNFHLPESTLIMLVSAFCGYDNTMNFYKKAVEERYRFFSFGDAMMLL